MVTIYSAGRQTGKTTMLVRRSAKTGCPIAVATPSMIQNIKYIAKWLDLEIPEPVLFNTVMANRHVVKDKPYLADELQMLLDQLNIDIATVNRHCVYEGSGEVTEYDRWIGPIMTESMRKKFERYADADARATKKVHDYMKKQEKQIVNVIFNNPATIVFWADGTKTVVKAENEPFDPEKGLAMAIAKYYLGNKHDYYNVFKKWLKKGKK